MHHIKLTKLPGCRGYRVTFFGRVIVERTPAPEGDAAIVLDALGITGGFQTFVAGKRRMTVASISEAAQCRRAVLAEIANAFKLAA